MKPAPSEETTRRLTLPPKTAAELMTPNPVSVRAGAAIAEAVELLTGRGISAAPVIDQAGRAVGVVSRADILVHDREEVTYACPAPGGKTPTPHGGGARVRDIMTPVVFAVPPQAPADRVVREMLELKVHRLFVVEDNGTLVGVISVLDVLRHLQEESVVRGP